MTRQLSGGPWPVARVPSVSATPHLFNELQRVWCHGIGLVGSMVSNLSLKRSVTQFPALELSARLTLRKHPDAAAVITFVVAVVLGITGATWIALIAGVLAIAIVLAAATFCLGSREP